MMTERERNLQSKLNIANKTISELKNVTELQANTIKLMNSQYDRLKHDLNGIILELEKKQKGE